jgi:hypothetical protein
MLARSLAQRSPARPAGRHDGVHCATMPIAVIRLLLRHPLTDIGLEKFVSDAKTTPEKAK